MVKFVLFYFLVFSIHIVSAQPKSYSSANAHSHNDYENPIPFSLAYENGFGSIEADIYCINDTLFVSHNKQDIKPGRTLKNLYLDPLKRELAKDHIRKLILLVDIKDDYKVSLLQLLKELTPLRKYLSDQSEQNQLTIVISGNRPKPDEYINYPSFIYFDDDLKLPHRTSEWARVGLVSLPFYRIARWNGKVKISDADSMAIKQVVDSVHAAGKRIRFWAAPDNELSWQTQMNLNIDLIGTDKILALISFLNGKQK